MRRRSANVKSNLRPPSAASSYRSVNTMLSIKGYLERLELLRLGNLSVRVHWIKDIDRTPFLHTHPFSYLSIITRGGYTEELLVNGRLVERSHLAGSFIVPRARVP